MKKKPKLGNGVDLMLYLFTRICESAAKKRITTDKNDIIVQLNSGPLDGRTVRLTRDRSDTHIEFHTYEGGARQPDHTEEAFLVLRLQLKSCGAQCVKRGRLYEQSFSNSQPLGLMNLCQGRNGGLPLLILFLGLLEELPSEYAWEAEIQKSWDQMPSEWKRVLAIV